MGRACHPHWTLIGSSCRFGGSRPTARGRCRPESCNPSGRLPELHTLPPTGKVAARSGRLSDDSCYQSHFTDEKTEAYPGQRLALSGTVTKWWPWGLGPRPPPCHLLNPEPFSHARPGAQALQALFRFHLMMTVRAGTALVSYRRGHWGSERLMISPSHTANRWWARHQHPGLSGLRALALHLGWWQGLREGRLW